MRRTSRLLLCLALICSLIHATSASCAACCATPGNTTACADASPSNSTGKCCGYNGNNVNAPVCCSTLDTCRYATDVFNLPSYTCSNGISSCFSCCAGNGQSCGTAFKGARGVCCGLIRSTSFCCGDPQDYESSEYPACTLAANTPSYNCEVPESSVSALALGLGIGIPALLVCGCCSWFWFSTNVCGCQEGSFRSGGAC